jgi:hypothetical protein
VDDRPARLESVRRLQNEPTHGGGGRHGGRDPV